METNALGTSNSSEQENSSFVLLNAEDSNVNHDILDGRERMLSIPPWQTDSSAITCPICNSLFNMFRRKHHCRICGQIFCDKCSSIKVLIPQFGYSEPVRVCSKCYNEKALLMNGNKHNSLKRYSSLTYKDIDLKEWLLLISNPDKEEKLKAKIFQGIPDNLRSTIWPVLAKISPDQLSTSTQLYQRAKRNNDDEDIQTQINTDVQRTFPEDLFFKDVGGEGQKGLSNILSTYSNVETGIGYSQGMNFIAAILLLVLRQEELAFCVFHQLMTKYELEKFFLRKNNNEEGNLLDQSIKKFSFWLKKMLPNLHAHLETLQISPDMYAMQWIRTVYSYCFPLELVFRIWDVFLLEGVDFLIWFALAFFHNVEDQLLQMNHTADIMTFFTKLPSDSFDAMMLQLKLQS